MKNYMKQHPAISTVFFSIVIPLVAIVFSVWRLS